MKREDFFKAVRQIESECAKAVEVATASTLKMSCSLEANGYNRFYMVKPNGEPYFGLDFTVKYGHFFTSDPDELKFNIGTMGEFDDEKQVNLYSVFGKVVSNKDIQKVIVDSVLRIREMEQTLED